MPTNFLPKGCSNLAQSASQGSGLPQQANRLYMLTVQRESLLKKKRTMETQLKVLNGQLKSAETEIMAIEKNYGKVLRRGSKKRMKPGSEAQAVKKVHLKY